VLKRGQNVGDRYIAHTNEKEVLELIVSGTPETALTADEALKQAA
jgi:simple sugar transport system ATP-binding protein